MKINYFKEINSIHKKIKKNIFSILLDFLSCKKIYKANFIDYKTFEMYNLSNNQRKTIITKGINEELIQKFNSEQKINYFSDNIKFNKKYNKYLLRDWLEINSSNYSEFKEFTKKNKEIIAKSKDNIKIYKINNNNIKKIYNELIKSNYILIEGKPDLCKELYQLNPSTFNYIKIITLNNIIVAAYLIIGKDKREIDNQLLAPINLETGIVDYLFVDKEGNSYERHPLTNEQLLWFSLPKWPRIKRFALKISEDIKEVGYVEWDISLNDKDPYLIKGNPRPNHYIYQLPLHRTNGLGLLPKFNEAIIKIEKEDKI